MTESKKEFLEINNANKEIERLSQVLLEKDECIDSLDLELCRVRKFLREKGLLKEFFYI